MKEQIQLIAGVLVKEADSAGLLSASAGQGRIGQNLQAVPKCDGPDTGHKGLLTLIGVLCLKGEGFHDCTAPRKRWQQSFSGMSSANPSAPHSGQEWNRSNRSPFIIATA